jgi:hypothetical protein
VSALDARVTELEAFLAAERAARAADAEKIAALIRERDRLRASHERLASRRDGARPLPARSVESSLRT